MSFTAGSNQPLFRVELVASNQLLILSTSNTCNNQEAETRQAGLAFSSKAMVNWTAPL